MDIVPSEVYMYEQLKIQRMLGLWPPEENTALWKRVIYKLVFYFMLGIKITTLTAVLYHMYLEWGHLPDPFDNIIILASHYNTIFGMIYIPTMIDKFELLIKSVDNIFIVPTHFPEEYKIILKETMRSSKFITMIFMGPACLTGFSYAAKPLLTSSNGTESMSLPYQASFPFDVSESPGYWVAHLLLSVSMMTICLNGTVNCDFFVSLIMKTTSQFRFLQLMILNVKEDALKRKKQKEQEKIKRISTTDEISDMLQSLEDADDKEQVKIEDREDNIDSELIQILSEFVKKHQELLQFTEDLESLASPFMLFQISVYVVFLCLNVFAMSMVAVGSIEFINTMLFVVTVISLLLMPAWYGNEIRVQSAELAKAASICDWIDAPHSFKTSLRLIIQRAQKPVQLTALKFCAVDLNMFTMVLKATYSYYQVLHKIFNE
ncbi:hypothetical protein ANN_03691 [Periplaneta americana]|uniref:Odorant receptor n=2 Tax=Periplaneta americana TaxID=6978 RepID=A0ABQ8TZM3_PERAM|nr:hypothetical protein ANN_03691 [Periplaneta americana]